MNASRPRPLITITWALPSVATSWGRAWKAWVSAPAGNNGMTVAQSPATACVNRLMGNTVVTTFSVVRGCWPAPWSGGAAACWLPEPQATANSKRGTDARVPAILITNFATPNQPEWEPFSS